jgi:hypothetical protein
MVKCAINLLLTQNKIKQASSKKIKRYLGAGLREQKESQQLEQKDFV